MPKFSSPQVWQQAEALMQPAFIRLVANIGKCLEQSTWKGEYHEILVWPEGTGETTQAEVLALQQQLAEANETEAIALQERLEQLPNPYPGHQLQLTHSDHSEPPVCVDLWDLCYQICFRDYDATTGTSRPRGFGQTANDGVEVDTSLLAGNGEVDWDRLDGKVRTLVEQIFANLPNTAK